MINVPNRLGRMTSFAPARMVSKRSCARQQAAAPVLLLREQAQAVLDDDDGAVDDDAEVDGAEAHQVGADLRLDHAGDGDQHRERDDAGRRERGAKIAENQKQDRRRPAARLRAGSSRRWRSSPRPAPCGRRPCGPSRLRAASAATSFSFCGDALRRPCGCSRRSAAWRCRPPPPRR